MDINRVDGVHEPSLNQPRQEEQRKRATQETRPTDEVSFSPEAQKAAEVARFVTLAKQLPDSRPEKLAQARERIASQPQDEENVYRTVARRMLEDLL